MKTDRSNIEAAKRVLPLPDLLRKLGFESPPENGGNMQSPFVKGRRQKSPSFSIFRRGENWGWCDRSGGSETKGDEVTLLEKMEGLSRAAAIARYLSLAGVGNAAPAPAVRKSGPAGKQTPARPRLDWPASVAKFTAPHAAKLAEWRGLSLEFVNWLHAQEGIGLCRGSVAFPVHDEAGTVLAAHVRPESGKWFYWPGGVGIRPFVLGSLATAEKTLVFESQWDAFAVMDSMGWHVAAPDGCAVLITRGASNGRLAAIARGKVYAWPQNDEEKGGKRAGEVWLDEVRAAAPGEVFRVSTPPAFEDANEWTRAGKVDVWAALASAVPVEKLSQFEKATGGKVPVAPQDAGGPTPLPFDPVAALDELGLYWLNGSPSYFLRREDGGRARFLEMGANEVRRKLRVRGFRARPNPEAGESVSQIDRILDAATETRNVDFAASIGGTAAGVYDLLGGRVLVRESPRLIKPAGDNCETIEAFLTALLGGDDALRLCGWLKIGYEALRAGTRRPGQALIITGPPDCGKSRIQHQIITPILAGRSADPKSFFFGRTDFNAELVGAEHLLIEEVPSSSKHEERLFFGERIKEIVANDTARLHKKNRDAVTVSPFWRLSITLNDNPEKLRCLPPLTDDLAEKIIMLQARPAPEFWQRFAGDADPRKAFRDAIERELPAFVKWLTVMTIPEKLQGRRYGVESYIPAELGMTIFESEPEHHLLLLIDKGLFPVTEVPSAWSGDAEDLKQALCGESSTVRGSAVRLLGGLQLATIGIWLSHLASKFPTRIEKHRTATKRGWIVRPPSS